MRDRVRSNQDRRDMEPAGVPLRRRPRLIRRLGRFLWNCLAVTGLFFIVYHMCFSMSVVTSGSMAPTLKGEGGPDSDWLLSERITYRLRRPRRWEVVHFINNEKIPVAKRVVGLPGESVSLVDKRLIIDGRPAAYPPSLVFLRHYPYGNLRKGSSASCGNGYYVLGDDSIDSADSRFDGPVDPKRIGARAWLIIWPLSRIGFVNP
jgi:signal peptidase I